LSLRIRGFRGRADPNAPTLLVPIAEPTVEAALQAARDYLSGNPDKRLGTMPLGTTMPLREGALLFRHGGGSLHGWRFVKAAHTLEFGADAWLRLNGQIRQGAVALWHADAIVRFGSAPRLRSRW